MFLKFEKTISWGFVTKDFVKPTAEGRQFINGKSHSPTVNLQINLVWRSNKIETSEPKERRLPLQLNWLKEKAIRSSSPLDMIDDMIAMASNWEERLQAPKANRCPTSLSYIFSPPDNSHKEREKVKPKSNDNLQKTNYNWNILTNYKHLALRKMSEHVKGMNILILYIESIDSVWIRTEDA